MRFSLNTIFIFGVMLHAPAFGADKMICAFKGVGSKEFVRTSDGTAFIGDDDKILTVLETERFLQLRTAEIDPDYVTNPFTVYLIDKDTKRIRQISAAMRAAPMMADGVCTFSSD